MRTTHLKLWQPLLGLLVVSSLACGGGDSKGSGCGDASCTEVGPAGLDGATTPDLPLSPDQAGPSVDQAGPTLDAGAIDQLPSAVDQAPATPDSGADAAADKPSDLPWGPEVDKSDLPVNKDAAPDQATKQDAAPDQATKQDGRDAAPDAPADLPPKLDAAPQLDTQSLDTQSLDTTAVDTGFADTDPTLPVVVPDKLVYSPGAALTASWNNGSTQARAWIGIYPVSDPEIPDQNYLDGHWEYIGDIYSSPVAGTVLLDVPGSTGTYELRLFRDSGYVRIATSLPFVVQ